MPLILRIDCDNAYNRCDKGRVSRLIKLALNYLNENYIAPHWRILGYLEHFYKFIDYLKSIGVRASIFFKYITLPSRDYVKTLISYGFEVGMHLYSATNESEFFKELERVRKGLGVSIEGFSKHGHGERRLSRKHAWHYEPEKYIKWGIKAGLKYFSGNTPGVKAETKVFTGKFTYVPQVFCVEPSSRRVKASIDEVVDHVNSGGLSVALVHPINWFASGDVRRELDRLLSKVRDIKTFKELLCR